MKKIPWGEIRERYENEKISNRALAKEYGISERSIGLHAKEEGWLRSDRIPTATEACVSSTVRHLARQLARAEKGEDVSVGEIKELAGVLKDLVKVRQALGETGENSDGSVQVEMSEEIEAWSK